MPQRNCGRRTTLATCSNVNRRWRRRGRQCSQRGRNTSLFVTLKFTEPSTTTLQSRSPYISIGAYIQLQSLNLYKSLLCLVKYIWFFFDLSCGVCSAFVVRLASRWNSTFATVVLRSVRWVNSMRLSTSADAD